MSSQKVSERELRKRLARHVVRLRRGASMTLEVASERGDLHWRHWQKVEAGQVNATLRTIVRLAQALEVDPGELLLRVPGRPARG